MNIETADTGGTFFKRNVLFHEKIGTTETF